MALMENKKGLMLVFFTAIISGFSIFVNSFGVKEFDSSLFTFLKNSVVALLLFAIIIGFGSFHELKKLKRKQWLQLVLIGLIGGSIPFLLFFKGLQMTTGTTSAFMHKTLFVFAAVFAVIFLREKLTKGFFIGAMLLMIGNYLLIKPDFNFGIAHLLVVIAVVFWAAENVIAKHVLEELSGTVVAFGRMFFGSIFMLVFLAATNKLQLASSLNSSHFMWIGITAVFLLLYNLTFYSGLKEIKATTAACILSIGSPITTLLGFIFSGKTISLSQAFGMLLIATGIISIIWLHSILKYFANILKVRTYGRN